MPAGDESSIAKPSPADEELFSFSVQFEIEEDSTKRVRNKLVDNRGFTYNVKRRRGNKTDWQCTVRPKVILLFNLHFYLFRLTGAEQLLFKVGTENLFRALNRTITRDKLGLA